MPPNLTSESYVSDQSFLSSFPDTYSSPTGHNYHHTEYEHYAPYLHHEIMPIIHEEHYYPSHYEEEEEEEEHWHRGSYKGKGELSIKDFFEITLTALAFLAFGLFIIQLLMNITVILNLNLIYYDIHLTPVITFLIMTERERDDRCDCS